MLLGRRRHTGADSGGSYLVTIRTISPGQPAPAAGFLFALPSDSALQPIVGVDLDHVFVFPYDCVLTRAHLHGCARTIGSVNTLGVGGATAHDVDLYVNGAFAETLLRLPGGAVNVDVRARPSAPIKAGDEVQFVVPVESNATGALKNFLFAFSIAPQ
jgi:hypothetical protein